MVRLKAHRVDAISEVEPFLNGAEVSLGAQPVLEQCTGPTADIPLGGYITTAAWADAHPATARAFAHAVEQGQALAASDRAAVEKVLPAYMPISKNIAALVNLNAFPTSADPVSQRSIPPVWDVLLGGKDNFAADRAQAQKLLSVFPRAAELARESREFQRRAVSYVAGAGIRQFLDIGCGLPTRSCGYRIGESHLSANGLGSWVDFIRLPGAGAPTF